jgi:uncharacterized membrane protein YdjX (TVP38/TMEM64 family)
MTRTGRMISYGSAGLLVLTGAICAIALGGTFGQVLAFVLIGLGFVLATSLVFLEVGLSEDRERERARRERRAKTARPAPPPNLDRMRGRQRRLR